MKKTARRCHKQPNELLASEKRDDLDDEEQTGLETNKTEAPWRPLVQLCKVKGDLQKDRKGRRNYITAPTGTKRKRYQTRLTSPLGWLITADGNNSDLRGWSKDQCADKVFQMIQKIGKSHTLLEQKEHRFLLTR